ncbi:MAG: hypothetical protein JNG82_00935 [Opitutaceae bacterium]|nr:hypothetical protein [Opitutaceae bacterium]
MNRFSRRKILGALLMLPWLPVSAASNRSAATSARKTLVAYFSRSGNTRVIAGQIHRALGTDLFEIEPVTPYPEDYEQTVEQARRERDRGYEPPLKSTVANIAAYETIFLGFPIWGETAPPIIRSFLSRHDLSGKTLIPFITHGGYGLGSSLSVLAQHALRARLVEGLTMEADQERRTLNTVTQWLGNVRLPR